MLRRGDFDKRRTEIDKKFRPILEAKDTNRQEKRQIAEQMDYELREIDYEESRYIDSKLFMTAMDLDVDIPSKNQTDLWDDSTLPPVLSVRGRFTLRKAIDDEKVRRRDVAAWWWKTVIIPGLAAATGLVGALTGLFAVLHHAGK